MDGKTIGYWVSTGLFALALGASGVGYLTGAMNEALFALGYPLHFIYLLGTWKVLGAIALLVPAFPRLKEWAYAGFFFNLTGAAVAHLAVDGVGEAIPPLVLLAILGVSYTLRPAHLSFSPASDLQPATN
ncbi:MAG: DoxX family protein [Myxococcota bacterium]